MQQDLLWWSRVLHTPYLNGSLEFLNNPPVPDITVEMDASDFGLCALDILSQKVLTNQFTDGKREPVTAFNAGAPKRFKINFQEFHSCAFAVHAWGHRLFTLVTYIAENRYPRSDRQLTAYLGPHSLADSTFDQYNRALNKWTPWSARHGVTPSHEGMPLANQVQHISEFILHDFQYGFGSGGPIRSDSIMTVLAGVRHFFTAAGRYFPIAPPHAASNLNSPPRRKASVPIGLLEACFHSLTMVGPFEQELWSVMCLAFVFLIRRSENVANTGGSFKWFAIRAQYIIVLDTAGRPTLYPSKAQSVYMRLIGSKTNESGSPTKRMLSRPGHPFALILLQTRKYLPVGIPAAVYLDRRGKPARITTADVGKTVKRAAVNTGQDPRRFSSHSLRAGGRPTCIEQARMHLRSNLTVDGTLMRSRPTPGYAKGR
ncbi:unnamed protein product [Phytophthora fragariaefolia]|uniref:Unnamed protein product n=1 Tax=Phytophthora fragariaefolia TaxID=1490495 RepID=A0A9W6XKS3_9STRA|nr:unnamed protein product [Phytophthora fragariaefolia]